MIVSGVQVPAPCLCLMPLVYHYSHAVNQTKSNYFDNKQLQNKKLLKIQNFKLTQHSSEFKIPMSKTVSSPGRTMTRVFSSQSLSGSVDPFSSDTYVPEKTELKYLRQNKNKKDWLQEFQNFQRVKFLSGVLAQWQRGRF